MDNITVIKYPSEDEVNQAIADKEPMLLLISFDGTEMIMSHIDEAMEHHILLAKADRNAAILTSWVSNHHKKRPPVTLNKWAFNMKGADLIDSNLCAAIHRKKRQPIYRRSN